MIERVIILLLVLGVALGIVWIRERAKPRRARIAPGITVVTGPDCRLCRTLVRALDEAGADYRRIDVDRDPAPIGVRALPTILVADGAGSVAMRRSGKAAISDLETVLAVAASDGTIRESA